MSGDVEDILREAEDLYTSGERERAYGMLRYALKGRPVEERFRILRKIAEWLSSEARWDELEEVLREMMNLAGDDVKKRINVLLSYANMHWHLGDLEKEMEYLMEAGTLVDELEDEDLQEAIYSRLATMYSDLGDWDRAMEMYRAALRLAKDDNVKAVLYNNMGEVLKKTGNLIGAVGYYRKSLEMAERADNERAMGFALENLAECHAMLGDAGDAEKYADRAMEIFRKLNNYRMIAATEAAYGMIYAARGEVDKAEEKFRNSYNMFVERGLRMDACETLYLWAKSLRDAGVIERAREKYMEAAECYESIEAHAVAENIRKEVSEL